MTSHVFTEALHRLVNDEPLGVFCDWFAAAMLAEQETRAPVAPSDRADLLRVQRHVALQLWGLTPVPSHRWRARGVPKLERNAPCHCGSGRKFKQCCAEFEHMPLPLPTEALLVMALEAAGPQWLTGEKLRQVPAMALGHAALNWNQAGQAQRTAAIVGPLFDDSKSLDERHEVALDALVDALQVLGQDRQRRLLLDKIALHPNKVLATAARCRLVSILADQGEIERSWKLFHEPSRFNPNDPQLWPLELTLLLSQGREEEARLRAPLLAARARQASLPDLAGALVHMAEKGLAGIADLDDEEVDDPEDLAWLALAEATPEAPDLAALQALYKVQRFGVDGAPPEVSVTPVKKLSDLNLRWRRKFMVGKPEMTWLEADVDVLFERLPDALAFFQKTPEAWLSAEVLDDLALAALQLCDSGAPAAVSKASQRLLDHALAVLRALVGDGQLHWIESQHRPLLRCLAVAIELARDAQDEARALALLQWGLALNPHDNHGWRLLLTPMLMERGEHEAALALMAQYPGDLPPSEHLRALALFALGRPDEAEPVLRQAHQRYPLFLATLLPELLDAPPPEPGPGMLMGGAESAWFHRMECRPMWVRSGALAWAAALKLPEPPPKPAKPPAKARKTAAPRPAQATAPAAQRAAAKPTSMGATDTKRLQKICSDYPRLHGFLQAVAWSPTMLMPNAWLMPAMAFHDRLPNSRTEATAQKALNDAVSATMALYNHLNQRVLDHLGEATAPLSDALQTVGSEDPAACAWAAGFLQGCELASAGWARAGHKITGHTGPFGRLRGLAARAALAPDPQGRVQQDDGKPLLLALTDDADSAVTTLGAALSELWPVVTAARGERR